MHQVLRVFGWEVLNETNVVKPFEEAAPSRRTTLAYSTRNSPPRALRSRQLIFSRYGFFAALMAVNLELPDKWAPCLLRQGETGMGYQTAAITLEDGRVIDDVLIVGGTIQNSRLRHDSILS